MGTSTLQHAFQPTTGGATVESAPVGRQFYEQIYQDAQGDPALVPWFRGEAHSALVAWLNAEAPCLVRPGCRVVVVGCGLGDDANELIHRGYDVTAFDVCPAAVEWARRRFPRHASCFVVEDAFQPPSHWRHRFDLVVEVRTLPAISPCQRGDLVNGIVELLHPNGVAVVVCLGRDERTPAEEAAEPPHLMTKGELLELMARGGLAPIRDPDDFLDDDSPAQRWLRGAFHRAG